ncbi:MAG: beta-galactosidase, partial [Chloroflexota bacterium]
MSESRLLSVSHKIDVNKAPTPIVSGHLNLGGTNPQGRTLAFNSYYMLQDGKPCIPVMGEFHFSRYDARFWEEELLKMKAGGISIVATYVFWNHIEEDEGVFVWSGNNNLRQFIALCAKHQIDAFVRIGPFAHGECRNGGIPDWMYGRPFALRSNDEGYLAYVKRFYGEISRQLEGTLFKDGGPVMGIQLENEYMHCGAPWEVTFRQGMEWVPAGTEGAAHIAILKQLAVAAGLVVPIYSCTGWRNSPIVEGEILPMQGGYAFTPWSPDPNYRQEPTREFIFRNRHLDPVLNAPATYDASRYPFVCCEIGGGIQDTYYHRPIVPPQSVEALAVMNLAGGSNLIGYYMYHGGSNPVGKHSYMNEYTVPRISYDFQAPIREFGQIPDSYRYLRLLHLFLKTFGDVLAPMQVALPDNASSITPEDTTHLRYAVREKDGAGFIFLNNYQDHVETRDIEDIVLEVQTANQTITLPHAEPLVLQKNVTAILPFGLALGGVELVYSTTQLLTKIEDGETSSYFFFAPQGMISEYAFETASYESLSVKGGEVITEGECSYVTVTAGLDAVIRLTTHEGKLVQIFTLTRQQAEHTTVEHIGQKERLLISEATLVREGDHLFAYSMGQEKVDVLVYPRLSSDTKIQQGTFTHYTTAAVKSELTFQQEAAADGKVVLKFPADLLNNVHNGLLRIDYLGDMGQAYIDG